MRVLQAEEMVRLQGTQEGAMMDRCELLEFQKGAVDAYGMPSELYMSQGSTACGFDPTAQDEVLEGTQVVITDAKLRLPVDTQIENLDRVRITHRLGTLQAEQPVYELIGEARMGASGIVCGLRLATKAT